MRVAREILAALPLTGYLAMRHLVLQAIPALRAMIDSAAASRCVAMACTCAADHMAVVEQSSAPPSVTGAGGCDVVQPE